MPLFHACKIGFLKNDTLIKNKNDINIKDKDGKTPLMYACYNDYFNIAKQLIKNGANVNAINYKNVTPLFLACINSRSGIVKLLIKNKVIINDSIKCFLSTMLFLRIDINPLLNYNINLKYFKEEQKKDIVKNFEDYYKINITNNKNEFYNVNCCHFMI